MNKPIELSFALMDAPFESARSTTALRLLAIAARRGCRIRVFAYEGAVMQTFARQQRHANPCTAALPRKKTTSCRRRRSAR